MGDNRPLEEIELDRQIDFLVQFTRRIGEKMLGEVSLIETMEMQEVLFETEYRLNSLAKKRRVMTNERFK